MFAFTSEVFHFVIFLFLVSVFSFSYRISFDNCKAGLVVLNSFSFCLSVKLLISPSNLNESLGGYSILHCRFFPFITLNIWCLSLLAYRVSVGKSADRLMGVPLFVICFSLAAFRILSLTFAIFIIICLGVGLFGFTCLGPSVLSVSGYLFPSLGLGIFQP